MRFPPEIRLLTSAATELGQFSNTLLACFGQVVAVGNVGIPRSLAHFGAVNGAREFNFLLILALHAFSSRQTCGGRCVGRRRARPTGTLVSVNGTTSGPTDVRLSGRMVAQPSTSFIPP